MRRFAFAAVFCFAAFLPGHAQEKTEFQKLADGWTEAFNKGDLAQVGQMYTEDAVLMPPEAELAKGRDAILAYWKREAERVGNVKVTVMDVKPLGTDAVHVLFTSSLKTKGPQAQDIPGKGATLAQKVGGEWRIATHVWNRDK